MTDGKATTTRTTFQLVIEVATDIQAPAATIWRLLTEIDEQRRWNSTLKSINGNLKLGGQVSYTPNVAPKRTFRPVIMSFEEGRSMAWMTAVLGFTSFRTYRLDPNADGSTRFALEERSQGFLLPIVARTFPNFGQMFEQTAADLKAAAEAEQKVGAT